jgi:hypothetical protein
LLPDGPYDLWREGETTRRARDLVGAFAQFPHLPKMLNPRAILDTLIGGCRDGLFVLRLARPDRSVHTFWRETPDEAALKDAGLELVLPETGELTALAPALLVPNLLPELWPGPEVTAAQVCAYFAGGRVVRVKKSGYDEPIAIPRVERQIVEAAIDAAVRDGKLWLTSGSASVLAEEIPRGLLTDDARLQAPPAPIPPTELLPSSLPEAWIGDGTTALTLSVALSKRAGKNLPWATLSEAIEGALRTRILERALDSGPWPCGFAGAQLVKLRQPIEAPPPPPPTLTGRRVAQSELRPNEIQDLADQIADIVKLAVGHELKLSFRIELGGADNPPAELVARINEILRGIRQELELR